jgi:hypothetical protein
MVAWLPCLLLNWLLGSIRSWDTLLLLAISLVCGSGLPLILLWLLGRLTWLAVGGLVVRWGLLRGLHLLLNWLTVLILLLRRLCKLPLLLALALWELVLCRLSILPLLLLDLGDLHRLLSKLALLLRRLDALVSLRIETRINSGFCISELLSSL